ncbi:hypothetical protein PanWU01x14_182810 [Parasponia andersonii]|uniref:Uncharacterized protein n=1 Tax=Parasponia andersonii TaxID=3476 RepID=A0A2P5C5H0_PARAD|nr:hypothetical protein PanWU01x14_182810 [Parasponia andersonii]
MPVIFVKLTVPVPIFHVLRNTGLGRVFKNAYVPILEVDHIDRHVELVFRQWVPRRLPPLAAFLIALGWGFLLQSWSLGRCRPLYSLQSRDLRRCRYYRGGGLRCFLTSTMPYGKFKSRWSDSIDPDCRPLMNELAACAESALCTRDITSRKRDKYSLGDSFVVCSNQSRSRMVFCCLRALSYCFKKSLQKSSNMFMDFFGSCLNYNKAGPAKVMEKTLQVRVVKSFGLGSSWIQSAKAVRLIPRTVCSARSSGVWL